MAWSVPLTAVSNATLTAAQWNASVRDNLLETAPAKATAAGQIFVSTGSNAIAARVPTQATVATLETTASTTFVDLATVGPTVSSLTTGTQAIISMVCGMAQNTSGGYTNASVAISGATTVSAGTGPSLNHRTASTSQQLTVGAVYLQALTAGSNTFKLQYNAGSGGGTASFFNRLLLVIPL